MQFLDEDDPSSLVQQAMRLTTRRREKPAYQCPRLPDPRQVLDQAEPRHLHHVGPVGLVEAVPAQGPQQHRRVPADQRPPRIFVALCRRGDEHVQLPSVSGTVRVRPIHPVHQSSPQDGSHPARRPKRGPATATPSGQKCLTGGPRTLISVSSWPYRRVDHQIGGRWTPDTPAFRQDVGSELLELPGSERAEHRVGCPVRPAARRLSRPGSAESAGAAVGPALSDGVGRAERLAGDGKTVAEAQRAPPGTTGTTGTTGTGSWCAASATTPTTGSARPGATTGGNGSGSG